MTKIKTFLIFLGDIVLLYGALFLTLAFRYGSGNFQGPLASHLAPFTFLFIIWLLIFFLFDLYQVKVFKAGFELFRALLTAVSVSAVISVVFFYVFTPLFKLTPKTNLLIFSLIFSALDLGWRLLLVKFFIPRYARRRLLVIDGSKTMEEIISYLRHNPQAGYDVLIELKEEPKESHSATLKELISEKKIDTLIIPAHLLKKDASFVKVIYRLLPLKIEIIDSVAFYEIIFEKVPTEELSEGWFIEEIAVRRRLYDFIKRSLDVVLSSLLGIILFPIALIIIFLIKLSSRQGPVIFKQERVGLNNKIFTLYKFGTMREDKGALWTTRKDKRITGLGKFLRSTHLDEIPQLWNIFVGDISFIGPRPERKELVELYGELPYYEMRHIIKPGLTGWAQLNYKASASVEEAAEKLKYDIYYIKNRSLFLDILIILKTIRLLFSKPE